MTKGWLSKRWKVLVRDGFRCQYCGRGPEEVKLEVDHRLPRKLGGKDNLENLICACFDCNRGKSANVDPLIRPELIAQAKKANAIKGKAEPKTKQPTPLCIPSVEPADPDWVALLRLEPRLGILEKEIKAIRPKAGEYCPNDAWYDYSCGGNGFRDRMSKLVGYGVRNPALNHEVPYMTAYDHLYNLLPECPKRCKGCSS